MPKDVQSIENLISSSGGQASDNDTTQGKFDEREKEIKIKETERATERKANELGAPYINLSSFSISPEALSVLPESESRRLSAVCFYFDGQKIRLGTTDYGNPEIENILANLKKKHYCEGRIYLISEHSFSHALNIYRALPKPRKFISGLEIDEEILNKYTDQFSSFKDIQNQINESDEIIRLVTIILAAAIKANSSDIHIEGEEHGIKIRFRIDGVLHDVASIKKELWGQIILRFKLLTKVKVNITNKPQDGRTSIFLKNERIDIRASFLPTNFGESLVMRLLRPSSIGLGFEDLGLHGRAFQQLKREMERPNGMIVNTGPTGSGKTTTLYAILKKLNNPETKIITIEDPIEYQLEGISQSQTSEKYTFAQGLRSIVRQDPDIIMVGEIRDLETAEISIQAALTGHLVLSTIHTNNAAGTIPRFLSMGTKPFLLAPALNALIGQRLVRKICDNCKTEDVLDDETLKKIKEVLEKLPEEEKKLIDFKNLPAGRQGLKFYKGKGCDACQEIGFKGRRGIFEIITMNKEIEKLILSGNVSEYDIIDIAIKNGMVTMLQDGLIKAIKGVTTVSEVFRVAEQK
jgi:type IV pilus assembly protein PilB